MHVSNVRWKTLFTMLKPKVANVNKTIIHLQPPNVNSVVRQSNIVPVVPVVKLTLFLIVHNAKIISNSIKIKQVVFVKELKNKL